LNEDLAMKEIEDVLEFWFGAPGAGARDAWFRKDRAFDEQIRLRFGALHARAAAGELDDWRATPRGCVALVLLLDQFSRNLHRDSPQAFACDGSALAVAEHAIAAGFASALTPLQRMFVYMPYQHSEAIERQRRSLELFGALREEKETAYCYDYAVRHFEVIAQFGRFPHRNATLGRTSTPQELEYLRQTQNDW
jgi:uncharacterized protein (DUF924 family)